MTQSRLLPEEASTQALPRLRPLRVATVAMHTAVGAQLVMPLLLIAYLVGSLLLTGGRVRPEASELWDALLPSPLFTVPDWLPLGLAIVSTAATVVLIATRRVWSDASAMGVVNTGAASAGSSWAFMVLSGGGFWLPIALFGGSAVLAVTSELLGSRRWSRLRAAGLLPNMTGVNGVTLGRDENGVGPATYRIEMPLLWHDTRFEDERTTPSPVGPFQRLLRRIGVGAAPAPASTRDAVEGATATVSEVDLIVFLPPSTTPEAAPITIALSRITGRTGAPFDEMVTALAGTPAQELRARRARVFRWRRDLEPGAARSPREIGYAFPAPEGRVGEGLLFRVQLSPEHYTPDVSTELLEELADSIMDTFAWR
ncbi:hypothetical protein ACFVAJ_05670 [Agromyces sp. NPDC057679]|uniref:hypothetical protein n=1 Tax=Agromyces sp. NPDC057679 TaxID=3346207 RepID=UPI00366CE443